ncbi:MAG: hypothetical protein N3G20_07795, partial [Verrucomicrobiae bacterium]|nr:hypothetical protein [Verrucomicrobiae bacterium]
MAAQPPAWVRPKVLLGQQPVWRLGQVVPELLPEEGAEAGLGLVVSVERPVLRPELQLDAVLHLRGLALIHIS